MIDATVIIRCDTSRFDEAMARFRAAVEVLNRAFEDRDKWHAMVEGEWPDRFVVLNRFVRTGVRPPYIFND